MTRVALEFLYRWGLEMAIILLFMKDRTQKSIAYLTEWGRWGGRGMVGCWSHPKHTSPPLTLFIWFWEMAPKSQDYLALLLPQQIRSSQLGTMLPWKSMQVPRWWEEGMLDLMIEQAEGAPRSLGPAGTARDALQQRSFTTAPSSSGKSRDLEAYEWHQMTHKVFKAPLSCWEPVQEHLVITKKLNLGLGCLVCFHFLRMVLH